MLVTNFFMPWASKSMVVRSSFDSVITPNAVLEVLYVLAFDHSLHQAPNWRNQTLSEKKGASPRAKPGSRFIG